METNILRTIMERDRGCPSCFRWGGPDKPPCPFINDDVDLEVGCWSYQPRTDLLDPIHTEPPHHPDGETNHGGEP